MYLLKFPALICYLKSWHFRVLTVTWVVSTIWILSWLFCFLCPWTPARLFPCLLTGMTIAPASWGCCRIKWENAYPLMLIVFHCSFTFLIMTIIFYMCKFFWALHLMLKFLKGRSCPFPFCVFWQHWSSSEPHDLHFTVVPKWLIASNHHSPCDWDYIQDTSLTSTTRLNTDPPILFLCLLNG